VLESSEKTSDFKVKDKWTGEKNREPRGSMLTGAQGRPVAGVTHARVFHTLS